MARCSNLNSRGTTIRALGIAVGLLWLVPASDATAAPKTVRLLTIGNSFAENALMYLPQIVEAAGHKVIIGRANLGGCTLERHWKHVVQHEENRDSQAGSPYGGGKHSLKEMLTRDKWDFITLQQVSYKSHELTTYQPFADNLYRYIKEHAPNATILVHQIWAYRVDDPRFKRSNEGKEPHTHAVMYRQVHDAYHTLARKLGLKVLPSGDAMFLADTDKKWGYRPDTTFDFTNAKFPALPDQSHSLHTGWFWRKERDGKHYLKLDGHHASSAGKYLLGCVWFETIFDESVVDNTFVPIGIESAYATFLRKTAHLAISAQPR